MGGRISENKEHLLSDRENWITDVSDDRLDQYDRMMRSAGASHRQDGTPRDSSPSGQRYFADLINREKTRRGR